METFVINLDRNPERLATASAALRRLGLRFSRIAAVDGQALGPQALEQVDQTEARRRSGWALTPGEIGCFLSHRAAAEAFLATPAPFGLVLEDDFAVSRSAEAPLRHFLAALPASTVEGWDLVHLGEPAKHAGRVAVGMDPGIPGNPLLHAYYFPVRSHAFLWSREGAQRFLEASETFHEPVDEFCRRWQCNEGRGLAFRRRLVGWQGFESTITGRGSKRTFRKRLAKAQRQVVNGGAAIRNGLAAVTTARRRTDIDTGN